MRTLALLLLLLCLAAARVRAEELPPPFQEAPFAGVLREQYYARLSKSPLRALGYELLLPGAGNAYTGLYGPAAVTLSATLLGAGLWIAGATSDHDALRYAGIATFAGARAYGVVSAPIGAALLNAAYRRQLRLLF